MVPSTALFSRIIAALFCLSTLNGCVSQPGGTALHDDGPDFPKPLPLKTDANLILLRIWVDDKGSLYICSQDRPDGYDIKVGQTEITMDVGDTGKHVLHTCQLAWDLGETKVTLKDAKIVFTKQHTNGNESERIYAAGKPFLKVSYDGVLEGCGQEDFVQIDAKSGRVVGYCNLKH